MFQLLNHRMFFAWMLSVIASYFVVGFFGNYYPSFVGILVLAVLAQTLLGLLIERLLGKAERLYASNKGDFLLALMLFTVLTVFAAGMLQMANQFPSLFDAKFVLLEQDQTFPFIVAGVLVIPLLALAGRYAGHSRFSAFVDSIAAGVLVASFFFAVYFIFSFIFNQPVFDTDDIFFDSDGWLWRTRFTTDVRI